MITVLSPVATNSGQPAPAKIKQTLDQSDFIRLLTQELKSQDPTNPVDNKDTIAQMAQFSSLSGINDINALLKQISAQLDRLAALSPGLTTAPSTT